MKFSLAPLLILLFVAIRSISQETKKVIDHSNPRAIVKYHVLKDDRTKKHGPYELYVGDKLFISGFYKDGKKDSVWQRYNTNGAVLTRMNYTENKRTGIWKFYDRAGAIVWQHNFNNDSSVNKPPVSPYSYLLNGEWVQGKADSDPVRLSSSHDWQLFLSRTISIPQEAINRKQQGKGVVELTIDENGDVIEYNISPESTYPSLGAEALRIVKLFEPEYLPAEKDGKKVKTKVRISAQFRLFN